MSLCNRADWMITDEIDEEVDVDDVLGVVMEDVEGS